MLLQYAFDHLHEFGFVRAIIARVKARLTIFENHNRWNAAELVQIRELSAFVEFAITHIEFCDLDLPLVFFG